MDQDTTKTINESSKGILDIGDHCDFCNNMDFLP